MVKVVLTRRTCSAQPPAHSDMSTESPTSETPPRRRRRSYEELAVASREAADRAHVRFQQKNAKAKRHEAQAASRARKLDTRRKIIAGALALEHAKRDEAFRSQLQRLLEKYVEGDAERALFGLAPLPPAATKGE